MTSRLRHNRKLRLRLMSWVALLVAASPFVDAADFQIVWVVIGDAASSTAEQPAEAGRHLFMASDLADMALKNIAVAKVAVEPTVVSLTAGERFCLSSLTIVASQRDRSIIKRSPLSVSVRQDHRDALRLDRRSKDICARPAVSGEYPIRFTSLLPASDGSSRGAQIFLRVRDDPQQTPEAISSDQTVP